MPVAPNGSFTESGPGGRTWGLTSAGNGRWIVSPSVNAKASGTVKLIIPGHAQNPLPSIWHKNPVLVGVSDGEEWQTAAP